MLFTDKVSQSQLVNLLQVLACIMVRDDTIQTPNDLVLDFEGFLALVAVVASANEQCTSEVAFDLLGEALSLLL